MLHNLWYNKKFLEKMGLSLKQIVMPPPRGKGGQVSNHSGTTRAAQKESTDAPV